MSERWLFSLDKFPARGNLPAYRHFGYKTKDTLNPSTELCCCISFLIGILTMYTAMWDGSPFRSLLLCAVTPRPCKPFYTVEFF